MITEKDKDFIEKIFAEESTAENMEKLDLRMKDPAFRQYYNEFLDQKFNDKGLKLIVNYAPILIFVTLIILGLYLWAQQ